MDFFFLFLGIQSRFEKLLYNFPLKMVISNFSLLILKFLEWLVKSEQVYPIRRISQFKIIPTLHWNENKYLCSFEANISEWIVFYLIFYYYYNFWVFIYVWIIENILKCKIKIIFSDIQNRIWHIWNFR